MRSILALSLLLAVTATANAATVHHRYRHYGDYRASHAEMFAPVRSPGYAPAPAYVPALPAGAGPGPGASNPYLNWGG